jgi:ATP-dependent exoDNAse (exonuclease V) beta subunit
MSFNGHEQDGKNLLVYNASAGSGKTYTLVKSYLKLALASSNAYYFKRILAITFTKKAAAEMKERILLHLRQLSAVTTDPSYAPGLMKDYCTMLQMPEERVRARAEKLFRAILHNYADLSVSTIDSFVHLIIRHFARDLRLPIDFEVVLEKDRVVSEAIDGLINDAGKDKAVTGMLNAFLDFHTDEGKKWEIAAVLKEFSKKALFAEDCQDAVNSIAALSDEDLVEVRNRITARHKSMRMKIVAACEKAISVAENFGMKIEDFAHADKSAFAMFAKLIDKEGRTYRINSFKRFDDAGRDRAWVKKADVKKWGGGIESVLNELSHCQSVIAEIREDDFFKKASVLLDNIHQITLIRSIDQRIRQIKNERDLLFIDDFNKMISALVMQDPAPFIYERIGEHYAHIMIDEFQDTSVMQWHNFVPLVENALARGLSCLLVGDGKQSIYRFRNGEVEQFVELPGIYAHKNNPLLLEKEPLFAYNFHREHLDTNYRSGKSVVTFNNAFFEELVKSCSNLAQRIYENHAQQVPEGKEYGYVEVQVTSSELRKREMMQVHLEILLKNILQSRNQGFALRDMAVLTRTNRDGDLVAQHLTENGIPVVSSDSLLISSSVSVQLVVALLRWLVRPDDEPNNGKILESYLQLHHPEKEVLHEINAVTFAKKGGMRHIDVGLFFKNLGIAMDMRQELRFSLFQLCEDLFRRLKLHREDAYNNAFLEQVFRFSKYENDVFAFLDWWEMRQDKLSVQTSEATDAVRILTIHKSKGLQYPIVFLPFVQWSTSKLGKSNAWLALGEAFEPLEFGYIPVNEKNMEAMDALDVLSEEKARTELDALNLLYVACTRAEERLYIMLGGGGSANDFGAKVIEALPKPDQLTEEIYKYGSETAPVRKSLVVGDELVLHQFSGAENWEDKLLLTYEHERNSLSGEASKRFGKLIHGVLSSLTHPNDLDKALEIWLNKLEFAGEDKSKATAELQRISEHPFFLSMFDGDEIRTESEIIDAQGVSHRPDRIVFSEGVIRVIDFKTGIPSEKHEKQIQRYGDLLQQMYPGVIELFLFYTSDNQVKKVS